MSVSTRNPTRVVGGQVYSGGPNTGEQSWTQGGQVVATFYSGGLLAPGSGFLPTGASQTADQLLLATGAGRLNTVLPHQGISGVAVFVYDSAVVNRSGKIGDESGYRVLAVVPANTIGAFGNQLGAAPAPMQFGTPFTSGLCVAARSGTPGCTISWTPEVVPPPGQ